MTPAPALPPAVDVREVGPRDGLQSEAALPVGERVRLVEALLAAGVRHVEVAAFVSPRAVPAMEGAAEVLAAVPRFPGVRYAALVPNVRGAELALATTVDELTVTVSASEEYSQRNVRMSVAESLDQAAQIAALARDAGVPVDVVVSCAFGSPWEGDADPAAVASLGDRLLDGGATAVTYADTTGVATPPRVHALLDETGANVGLHLHDTRGTGLLNAYAGLERGVSRFDAALGGLGGSPFAEGAGGNVATEELVGLLDALGIATGIDLDGLLAAAELCAALVGRPVESRLARARRGVGRSPG